MNILHSYIINLIEEKVVVRQDTLYESSGKG